MDVTTDTSTHGFTFPYHGSCSRCHHLHIGKPITIPYNYENEGQDYRCDKCQMVLFGVGGPSPRLLLASRFTTMSWRQERQFCSCPRNPDPPIDCPITAAPDTERPEFREHMQPRPGSVRTVDGREQVPTRTVEPVSTSVETGRAKTRFMRLFKKMLKPGEVITSKKLFKGLLKLRPTHKVKEAGCSSQAVHPARIPQPSFEFPPRSSSSTQRCPDTVSHNGTDVTAVADISPVDLYTNDANTADLSQTSSSSPDSPVDVIGEGDSSGNVLGVRDSLSIGRNSAISNSPPPATSSQSLIDMLDLDFALRHIGAHLAAETHPVAERLDLPMPLQGHPFLDLDSNTVRQLGVVDEPAHRHQVSLHRRAFSLPTARLESLI